MRLSYRIRVAAGTVSHFFQRLVRLFSLLGVAAVIYDIGFDKSPQTEVMLDQAFAYWYSVLAVILSLRFMLSLFRKTTKVVLISDTVILLFYLFISDSILFNYLSDHIGQTATKLFAHTFIARAGILALFVVEWSRSEFKLAGLRINPSLMIAGSFLFLILAGTGLLLLPRATTEGISVTDAFFTATSAVCVTGLIVVDTATSFTVLGQTFILLLIQAGGLGIMTFTYFFGFLFHGGGSIQTEILLRDMINEDRLGNIFNTLLKVVLFTFFIEAIGTLLIYFRLDPAQFSSTNDQVFFAIFHSVSAFCNAGFSTFTDGLYHPMLRTSYFVHLIIALLIILGGLGFPIILNYYRYVKSYLLNLVHTYFRIGTYRYMPRLISINTRIVVSTTIILLLVSTTIFYFTEYNGVFAGAKGINKVISAFFLAVTPRTAGFSTINPSEMIMPTLLLVVLLMWIGASPGSTGGGIKTSAFAMAILNIIAMARGHEHIEIAKRNISQHSVKRAFAVIFLSLVVIGASVLILEITESEKFSLFELIFETVSAFSTVGLSLGITPSLSTPGKWVIVFTMFIGRVGMLTLIIGLVRKAKTAVYELPSETVLIN